MIHQGVDDPLVKVTGKSKLWILAPFFFLLDIICLVGAIIGFIFPPSTILWIICVSLGAIRSLVKRLFCKSKEKITTFRLDQIISIGVQDCCIRIALEVFLPNDNEFFSPQVFKDGELDPIFAAFSPALKEFNDNHRRRREEQNIIVNVTYWLEYQLDIRIHYILSAEQVIQALWSD
ncbi:MAG: hypothetical protein EZS28_003250 [Streblomastix strix]|uniref:Uncharacterized protein n=1 Tax=Streblomastix strix TaxID=222440 RepID=A0A5J4X2I3_9EUKA|nr:MAG: hypothetical protein EZS28_003250 [Streblomastix strix]